MDQPNGLRVAVVDDEPLVRALVADLVAESGYDVSRCANFSEAVAALEHFDPNAFIIDLDLGDGPSGVDLLRYIAANCPWVATVVMSSHRNLGLVDDAPHEGAVDVYLVKADIKSADEIRASIRAAISGERFTLTPEGNPAKITSDQAQLLRLIAQGLTNAEIAKIRGTSVRAVDKMAARLYITLGISENNPRIPASRMYQQSKVDIAIPSSRSRSRVEVDD